MPKLKSREPLNHEDRIYIRFGLSTSIRPYLDKLVQSGVYGSTYPDLIRNLITKEIIWAIQTGVIRSEHSYYRSYQGASIEQLHSSVSSVDEGSRDC